MQLDEDNRKAFVEAVCKLADDPQVREAFLKFYHLSLCPPLVLSKEAAKVVRDMDLRPGSINFVDEEQMELLRQPIRFGVD